MWTLTQIAERDGVSKQAVQKKVAALVDLGLIVERAEHGWIAAVNVVDYDRLRGRTDDPSKAAPTRAAAAEPVAVDPESYAEALRQKTWHEAERRKLENLELKGLVVRTAQINEALDRCGEEIAAIIDRLPTAADDLAAAYAHGGLHDLRLGLKHLGTKQRGDIADALERIAIKAPADGQLTANVPDDSASAL